MWVYKANASSHGKFINTIITKGKKIDEVYEGKVEFIYISHSWNFKFLILGILRTFQNVKRCMDYKFKVRIYIK